MTNYEHLDTAIVRATPEFMDVVSANHPMVKRDAGIPATINDIRVLRKFFNYAQTLPEDLHQIQHLLGYQYSHIPGLDPVDIRDLYRKIKDATVFWPHLERKMKEVGTGLVVTSGNLEHYGQFIIDFAKSIEGYSLAQLTLGDVKDKTLAQLPNIPLPTNDAEKIPTLLSLVVDIVDTIKEQQAKAEGMKDALSAFKSDFREIESAIGLKVQLATPAQNDDTRGEMTRNIERISERIEEELRTYEKFTTYTWIGAWWGPVGLLISYSIYGDDAANARSRLEQLRVEKLALLTSQENINDVLRNLVSLQIQLQNLELLIADATASTAHLESLWSLLIEYINQSVIQLEKTNSATLLYSFISRLTIMINNWKQVKPDAQRLLNALDDVINE